VAPGTKRWLAALIALLLAALTPLVARAVDWESLVMPGPVISGHADIEKECRKCHAPFARDDQRGLCLDCHDKVDADIRNKSGFHWRSEAARTGQCRNCHTEHEGRAADVVRLTPQTFNHALTDYPLEGGHRNVACSDCHAPNVKHREAPSTCIGCHAEDDAHKKALGDDCAACHSVDSWKQTRFDHAKASDPGYPLTGAHEKVDCGLCHAGQRYKDTPTTCVACHRIDDAHQGQRGTDCESCHTTAEWKEQKFDHFRKTGFALTAGHSGLACVACHAGNDFRKTDGKACVDCHRSDDTHQGRNGVECKTCHTTKSWKDGKFDHSKETKFALKGAHAELGCVACHKGAAKTEKLETTCVSCHRGNDPHQESLGTDCGTCHGEKTWQADVRFDHDLTDFPLAGLHATTSCDSCHVDKKFAGTKSDLRCVACHVRPPGEGRGMARDCGSCHRRDDRHNGQFGADCARCHNTRTFSGARRSR
jgi:hypothetical protein